MAIQTKDFSVSGLLISGQGGYAYTLRVTEDFVDSVNNCSNVTVQAILRQINPGAGFSDRSVGVSCTVNDATVFSHVASRTVQDDRENILYTWSQVIPHQLDGSMTLRISGRVWSEGQSLTIREGEMQLTPTPRPSTVRAVDTAIGSACAVAIMAISDAFTHTVAYRFGNRTGYLTATGGSDSTPHHLTGGMVYWTVPESFYDQIPNKRQDLCHLTCTTFYKGVQMGAPQQTAFYASASEAVCKPALSANIMVVDETTAALTGGAALIRYHSTLRCVPNAIAQKGAYIVQTLVNGLPVTGNYLDIPEADADTYLFTTRDSRGWEAEQKCTIPVIPYESPTLRITARRYEPGSTNVSVHAEGTYDACDFGLQQNTVTMRYVLDGRNPVSVPLNLQGDGTFAVNFRAEGVDYTQASRLTVIVQDLVTETEVRIWVQPGAPVFHWDRERFTFRVPVETTSSVAGMYFCQGSGLLQTGFSAWEQAGQQQPVLLFGAGALGVLTVGSDGAWQWNGSPQLEFTKEKDGCLQLPSGTFGCLSPAPITIKEE